MLSDFSLCAYLEKDAKEGDTDLVLKMEEGAKCGP